MSNYYIPIPKDEVGGTLCRSCGHVEVGNLWICSCKKCRSVDLMGVTTKRTYKNKNE